MKRVDDQQPATPGWRLVDQLRTFAGDAAIARQFPSACTVMYEAADKLVAAADMLKRAHERSELSEAEATLSESAAIVQVLPLAPQPSTVTTSTTHAHPHFVNMGERDPQRADKADVPTPLTDALAETFHEMPNWHAIVDAAVEHAKTLERKLSSARSAGTRITLPDGVALCRRGPYGENYIGWVPISKEEATSLLTTHSARTPIHEVAFEHAMGTLQGMVERAADHPEEMNRISAKVEGVLLEMIRPADSRANPK